MDQASVVELSEYIFPTPCTISLVGPSGSGKTTLLINGLLKYCNEMFGPKEVAGILYFYSEDQPAFEVLRQQSETYNNVKLIRGLPSREEFETMIEAFNGLHFLIILDDLMEEMANSALGQDIFTKLSHHR